MCGRYVLYGPRPSRYDVDAKDWPGWDDHYNITPSLAVPVIRQHPDDGRRVAHLLRWGLVPHWVKSLDHVGMFNNARAEGVADKPSFRAAYAKRRCLIPANGFYEWQAIPGEKLKQPWYIHLNDDAPLMMAGLWESWTPPEGEVLRSCCILTTGPNALMATIHDRMPVILTPGQWDAWLNPITPRLEIDAMLVSYPADGMAAHKVSRAVSNARTNTPSLIAPT